MREKFTRYLKKTPICGIYQIKNIINNKIYIGQSIDIERRWYQHRYGKGNIIIKNAINKYGIENFKFTILESIEFINKNLTTNILTKLEGKYLKKFKPFLKENGYNIQKTSKPNLTPKKNEKFGELISKIKIENNHCGKPVIQYDLNGNFIKEWQSAASIERELGYKAENISGCCLKKQNSSNFFIWRFKGDELTNNCIKKANKSCRMSEVRQYNLNGELLNTFNNIKIASTITNINETVIRNCCNGFNKTGGGYIWKFKNEPLILEQHKRKLN